MQVEICASTLRDVAVAMEVGADRVELCSVWTAGGLTPSAVLVQSAVAMGMPVRALVRPREGHFVWSNSERTWSVEEAKLMLDCGAEAVVVGGLNQEGTLDEAYLEAMCRAVGPKHVVWHRAIDVSHAPEADVDKLLDAGVTSVLSSGGCTRAVEGLPRLAQWAQQGLQVVAGGGVKPEDVEAMAAAQLHAVHASCRVTLREGHSPLFDSATHPVDVDKAVALMQAAEPFLS